MEELYTHSNHITALVLRGKVAQRGLSNGTVGKLGSLGYSALRERKGVSRDREQKEGGKEGWGGKEEVGEGQDVPRPLQTKASLLFSMFGFMEDFTMGQTN